MEGKQIEHNELIDRQIDTEDSRQIDIDKQIKIVEDKQIEDKLLEDKDKKLKNEKRKRRQKCRAKREGK